MAKRRQKQDVDITVDKEAREKLYSQILHSYELVMDQQQAQSQSVDVLVVYARDPISKVQSDLGGGTNYLTSYGVTRKAIVDELSAHEHDSHYLGTPYADGAVQSTWTTAKGQIRTVVDNVVFPVIDMILAILFFVKADAAWF